MKYLAMIPARGGSKRIPRKNIQLFCGKPIIAYSIEAALKSGVFDEVMVSTDDEEIAKIALEYGAKVPFLRGQEASNDITTSDDVLPYVLKQYAQTGQTFDYAMMLYATAPFVTPERIREAMALIQEKKTDRLICITPFSFPPQRAYIEKDGNIEYQYPEYALMRSQDLQPIYHDCGQFYIFDVNTMNTKPWKDITRCAVVIPEELVQDIDTESDWHLAEVKYKQFVLGEK